MTNNQFPLQPDPLPISLKPSHWPEADRRAWAISQTTNRSPFRKDYGGPKRSSSTTRKIEIGYGRFVSFLAKHHPERLEQQPRDRLSLDIRDDYFAWLTGRRYADHTVVGAFDELRQAMTWMFPGADFSFVTKPNGAPLSWRLPMKSKQRNVPHQIVWLACARSLFESGLVDPNLNSRCRKIRDAVLLGLLATAAPLIIRPVTSSTAVSRKLQAPPGVVVVPVIAEARLGERQMSMSPPANEHASLWIPAALVQDRTRLFAVRVGRPGAEHMFPDGTMLICMALPAGNPGLADGQRVVTTETHEDGVEVTVRRIQIHQSGVYAWPDTDDPRRQRPALVSITPSPTDSSVFTGALVLVGKVIATLQPELLPHA